MVFANSACLSAGVAGWLSSVPLAVVGGNPGASGRGAAVLKAFGWSPQHGATVFHLVFC